MPRKKKRFDQKGCPRRCGGHLTLVSRLPVCQQCGALQRPVWGGHNPDIAIDVEYACGRDYAAGYQRRPIRYESDADNLPAIGDRPGKQTREIDR